MNEKYLMSISCDGKCEICEHYKKNYLLEKENTDLKKQLEYLRSGEYLNQLKFERNMLENIVQNMEVSKEDKEFIDMTHRNTGLLEENQELKIQVSAREEVANDLQDRNNKAVECIEKVLNSYKENPENALGLNIIGLLKILKEDNKEE